MEFKDLIIKTSDHQPYFPKDNLRKSTAKQYGEFRLLIL